MDERHLRSNWRDVLEDLGAEAGLADEGWQALLADSALRFFGLGAGPIGEQTFEPLDLG